ncbi:MAG: TrkH family potassium uptake protein [Methanolinea sp.]|nr:TrkH family potassium uptake protein [Methanolinea sp.]
MGRLRYFSVVLGELGEMLVFMSPLTAFPLVVAAAFGEWNIFLPLAAVPAGFFACGTLLDHLFKRSGEVRFSAALCSVALLWLSFALIACIPFMLILDFSFTDALFESMAGWTGTGFSLIQDIPNTPSALLFWRTYMQWLGGLAIISLSLTLAFRSNLEKNPLFRLESRSERIIPSVVANGKEIWAVYILLTVISVGIIMIARVPLWDALHLALSAISTGGFLPVEGGIPAYHNQALEFLLVPVMVMGSVPFSLFYMTYRNRKISFLSDEQVRILLYFLFFGSLIVVADLLFIAGYPLADAVRQGLFMTAAVVSTTGFQNAAPQVFPNVTLVFLTMLMFIGGSSGSTAGGIHFSRIALGYRGIIWWFRRAFVRGTVLIPFRYQGQNVPVEVAEPELSKGMLVIILSVITVFVATMAILEVHIISVDVTDLVFDIVSALSSCGISAGYVNPAMPLLSKWVFIVTMWLGRLEVIPVIVLFISMVKGTD